MNLTINNESTMNKLSPTGTNKESLEDNSTETLERYSIRT